jgi:hypothetical protein
MSEQRISVTMEFPQPVETIFAFLAKHENQAVILDMQVERLRDGEGHPDGVGSMRRLRSSPLPAFEETVTVFELNKRIEYRITQGSPLRNHHGTLLFTPSGTGTRLDYTITFEPKIPLTGGLIRKTVEASLRKGLELLAKKGATLTKGS